MDETRPLRCHGDKKCILTTAEMPLPGARADAGDAGTEHISLLQWLRGPIQHRSHGGTSTPDGNTVPYGMLQVRHNMIFQV